MFKRLNLEKNGVNVDGDDVALTTTSVKDMEVQLKSLDSESKKIGLKNTQRKKKSLWQNYDTNESIEIENEQIEKVESYKYLGQTVKMLDDTREGVLIRIKADWRCFPGGGGTHIFGQTGMCRSNGSLFLQEILKHESRFLPKNP